MRKGIKALLFISVAVLIILTPIMVFAQGEINLPNDFDSEIIYSGSPDLRLVKMGNFISVILVYQSIQASKKFR